MKILKLLLFVALLLIVGTVGISLIGFIYSGIWYLLGAGILGLGGYAAYKFMKATNFAELEPKPPIAEIDYNDDALTKQLEDFKQKLLK